MLSACANRLTPSSSIEFAVISHELKEDCGFATLLPEGTLLNPALAAEIMIETRTLLSDCRETKRALVEAIEAREHIQGITSE